MKREKLEYIYIFGSGDFFQSRFNLNTSRTKLLLILCSHEYAFNYTRFHALMLSSSMTFYVEENHG